MCDGFVKGDENTVIDKWIVCGLGRSLSVPKKQTPQCHPHEGGGPGSSSPQDSRLRGGTSIALQTFCIPAEASQSLSP